MMISKMAVKAISLQRLVVTAMILMLLIVAISEAKSLTGPGRGEEAKHGILGNLWSNDHRSRDSINGGWTPSSGTREEWMAYHGMSRDQWNHILRTLEEVDYIEKGDVMRDLRAEPTDRVAEGCLWYTQEQAEEALQTALMEKLHPPEHVGRDGDVTDKDDDDDLLITGSGESSVEDKMEAHSRQKRKIVDFSMKPERKWTNPILYKFDGTHTDSQKDVIRNAFKHWEQHTCMKFFEISNKAKISKEHLLLTGAGYGCYSFVGKTGSIPQQINLAPICLTQFGIPVHEIGHALGLWHEHQRSDRDKWVKVLQENIDYFSGQFWKRHTVSHGVPYDFGSVMHYSGTSGSRSKKYTLMPLDPLYKLSMGQRVQLSYMDAKIINLQYCQGECSKPLPVPCERGGYQDPNDCYSCICPDGFGGRYCQEAAKPTRAECGGIIHLDREEQTIQTPGFENPGFYDDNTECNWIIKAPENHKVQLTFERDTFGVYCLNSATCFHWVEIKYKTDFEYPGPRFCCYDNPNPMNLTSETNEMAVIFKSNFPTNYERTRQGFRATLVSIPPEGRENSERKEAAVPNVGQTVTTTSTTTTQPPGTFWSEWSEKCSGHQCQCGGCSYNTRIRMCGPELCKGDLAAREKRPCSRQCQDVDKFLQYTGKFIRSSCPVCCPGYNISNTGDCEKVKKE